MENIIRAMISIDLVLNYSPKITHIRQKYNISLLFKTAIYFLPSIAQLVTYRNSFGSYYERDLSSNLDNIGIEFLTY